MTKTELIAAIAEKTGTTKKASGLALDALIETITETLASGEDVTLVGFGKFYVTDRAARQGVNPQTLEAISIPACKVPKFKVGAGLKDAVKNA